MLFNSIQYAFFLPIVFLLYWFVFGSYSPLIIRGKFFDCKQTFGDGGYKLQNAFIVVVSYFFYGCWNWRLLSLIALTSFLSWATALLIACGKKRKIWLSLNIVINLGILALFKYYNFFVGSFCHLLGIQANLALNLLLPVGISFYTFQALSYSIDVYRKRIFPTHDIIAFFAYVSFFPQLVAGPIERATNLLPQFERPRLFSYAEAEEGMRSILWGLFKKVVIADNCALYVDMEWADYANQNGTTLLLAAILFAIQIYCDFSGYSDIAIGSAQLLGIKLKANFRTPYFSRNVAEFWKRWHISLNTWFVDYVYIPLGGSRDGRWKTIRNTLVIFLLSGLWHGANWTYVAWGVYHALLFIPLILLGKTKQYNDTPRWQQLPQMLLTFAFVVFGWIIFRSNSIAEACDFVWNMFKHIGNGLPFIGNRTQMLQLFCSIVFLMVVEWNDCKNDVPLSFLGHRPAWMKAMIYLLLAQIIFHWGRFDYTQFIYFQF